MENGIGFDSMNDCIGNYAIIQIFRVIYIFLNRKVLNLDNSQENDDNGEENLIMIDFEDLNLSSLCQCYVCRQKMQDLIIDIDECRVFAYTNYNGNGSLLSLKAECKHLCISGILFHTDNEDRESGPCNDPITQWY
ncbi:Papilin [Dirofilaria immitis]